MHAYCLIHQMHARIKLDIWEVYVGGGVRGLLTL